MECAMEFSFMHRLRLTQVAAAGDVFTFFSRSFLFRECWVHWTFQCARKVSSAKLEKKRPTQPRFSHISYISVLSCCSHSHSQFVLFIELEGVANDDTCRLVQVDSTFYYNFSSDNLTWTPWISTWSIVSHPLSTRESTLQSRMLMLLYCRHLRV